MTEISFHFNVADRIDYACRLLRKAWRRAAPIAVTGADDDLRALDAALWRVSPVDFVAHGFVADATRVPARLRGATVWLTGQPESVPAPGTLVNLGRATPRGFESFDRLIELVSTADDERDAARERWKGYVRRGYAIQQHEAVA